MAIDLETYSSLNDLFEILNSKQPFNSFVAIQKIEGDSYYPTNHERTMGLSGIAIYNTTNEYNPNSSTWTWDILPPLKDLGLGFGLLVSAYATNYNTVLPLGRISSVEEFNSFKLVKENRYCTISSEQLKELFENTFSNKDIELLIEKFKEDAIMEISIPSNEEIENMKNIIDSKKEIKEAIINWLNKGFKVAHRHGFGFKGAKANPITKSDALKLLNNGGLWLEDTSINNDTLILQSYSDNDLY